MRRSILWGLVATLVALAMPGAASATTCTPTLTNPIVRFATTLGNIDVQLNTANAPCTVNNFLSYVDSKAYNGSFFHRSVTAPDVVQGGGYTFASGQPVTITQQPAITNEYSAPNIQGSLAMALSGTSSTTCELDDSATDQFFFNVADNSSTLDPQCFTVFGQVIDPASTNVLNQIAAAQICSLSTQFHDTAGVFATVPTVGYPAGACKGTTEPVAPPTAATASNLIFVNSISVFTDKTAPAITITSPKPNQTFNLGQKITPAYSCSDGTGVGVQACTGAVTVDTTLYGTIQYSVTATDYAGNTSTKSVSYVVELPPTLTSFGDVSTKGVLWFKLHCPSTVACAGNAVLAGGKKLTLFGTTRFSVRSNGTGKLKVVLTGAGYRLWRAARWRLKATLAITPSGTGSQSSTQSVTLVKAPAPKKHSKPSKKH